MAERSAPAAPLGAVLAGGGSRRMGTDKALLRWRGVTLLEHACRTLSAVLDEVVVVGGDEEAYGFAGHPVLADRRPGLGPLGGLATALDHAAGRAVFVLACDLPLASSALVAHLVERAAPASAGEANACLPRAADRLQPLCAHYSAACAAPLARYLEAGERRAIEFLDRVATTVVEVEPEHPLFRPRLLANVNRPADLEALAAADTADARHMPPSGRRNTRLTRRRPTRLTRRRHTPPGSSRRLRVMTMGDPPVAADDLVAAEEPMEIRVIAERHGRREAHPLAITMRTPGHDLELAAGFLLSEGIVTHRDDLWRLTHCLETEDAAQNVVEAYLAPHVDFDPERFRRNVYTTSSCGLCGKASIERLETVCPQRPGRRFRVGPGVLKGLPARLTGEQTLFAQTGGLHASGLFNPAGELERVREDVGRHNALDKLIGSYFLAGEVPLADAILLVSGRASFELVQKSLIAGLPILCAVGAPSTLAVETAAAYGQTLIGFLSQERFNVYAGSERLDFPRG